MKTKHILLGLSALLAAGGVAVGRLAWRAHRQIVTLNVHEAPLGQVLRQIQWQTWRKIRAESLLDARITLQVVDMPLSNVLDRIAEQAGAHWSTLYAVYESARGLKALDAALRGDGKLEPVGWKKLGPEAPAPDKLGPGQHLVFKGAPAAAGSAASPQEQPPEGAGDGPPGDAPPPSGGKGVLFTRGPNGPLVIQRGGDGQVEIWSPEELVIESHLGAQLSKDPVESPSPLIASQTAQKVHGRWTTYLAFRKSIMGPGSPGMYSLGHGPGPLRHNPADRFLRLTPEQRVEQARQRTQIRINDHSNPPF